MQLQGPYCQHLALCDPDHGRNVSSPNKIRLDHLLSERDGGCGAVGSVAAVLGADGAFAGAAAAADADARRGPGRQGGRWR